MIKLNFKHIYSQGEHGCFSREHGLSCSLGEHSCSPKEHGLGRSPKELFPHGANASKILCDHNFCI
jgi:hypothetical protein